MATACGIGERRLTMASKVALSCKGSSCAFSTTSPSTASKRLWRQACPTLVGIPYLGARAISGWHLDRCEPRSKQSNAFGVVQALCLALFLSCVLVQTPTTAEMEPQIPYCVHWPRHPGAIPSTIPATPPHFLPTATLADKPSSVSALMLVFTGLLSSSQASSVSPSSAKKMSESASKVGATSASGMPAPLNELVPSPTAAPPRDNAATTTSTARMVRTEKPRQTRAKTARAE